MDIGRLLIFIPLAMFWFYSFKKSQLNIYLIVGTCSWCAAFYSGKLNVYQFIQEPFKSIINMISLFLLIMTLFPYFKKSITEYKEYKGSINEVEE